MSEFLSIIGVILMVIAGIPLCRNYVVKLVTANNLEAGLYIMNIGLLTHAVNKYLLYFSAITLPVQLLISAHRHCQIRWNLNNYLVLLGIGWLVTGIIHQSTEILCIGSLILTTYVIFTYGFLVGILLLQMLIVIQHFLKIMILENVINTYLTFQLISLLLFISSKFSDRNNWLTIISLIVNLRVNPTHLWRLGLVAYLVQKWFELPWGEYYLVSIFGIGLILWQIDLILQVILY